MRSQEEKRKKKTKKTGPHLGTLHRLTHTNSKRSDLSVLLHSRNGTYLRLLTVHVQRGQFVVNQLHSYGRQRGLLLQLADGSLYVLHDHLGISVHIQNILMLTRLLKLVNTIECFYTVVCLNNEKIYLFFLPVLPSNSDNMRFLVGQKTLEVFNVVGLSMKHDNYE